MKTSNVHIEILKRATATEYSSNMQTSHFFEKDLQQGRSKGSQPHQDFRYPVLSKLYQLPK